MGVDIGYQGRFWKSGSNLDVKWSFWVYRVWSFDVQHTYLLSGQLFSHQLPSPHRGPNVLSPSPLGDRFQRFGCRTPRFIGSHCFPPKIVISYLGTSPGPTA